ncbi:hypothetical protein GCM10022254_52740 [Actinomadura meridiana]|uniref:Uncharacterized protein n=1 Tax=Actinomadura meridiana TaxID=559626 RepID=A0ABP8CEK9_9ACTN
MPDWVEATLLALDAYQQHLLGDLPNGHRTDRAEAQGVLHSLVVDLVRYGEGNRLDVSDLIHSLVQAQIDRGGALSNPRYSFRLNTEVQFHDREAEHHRGFITELGSRGRVEDAECVLRVPGIIDPQRTRTSQLEPASRMVPQWTRTCGIVFSALEAEDALIEIITRLPQGHEADPQMRADAAELSTALALWSGIEPERVLHHVRHLAGDHPYPPDDRSFAARRAAIAFPNNIAALLAGEQDHPVPSSRPDPPHSSSRPRGL